MSNSLRNFATETLEEELNRRKRAKSTHPPMIQKPDWAPLLKMVEENAKQSVEDCHEDDDFDHYVYECVMQTVYGPNYFDWHNRQSWNE